MRNESGYMVRCLRIEVVVAVNLDADLNGFSRIESLLTAVL
jgi:hypothetical protein